MYFLRPNMFLDQSNCFHRLILKLKYHSTIFNKYNNDLPLHSFKLIMCPKHTLCLPINYSLRCWKYQPAWYFNLQNSLNCSSYFWQILIESIKYPYILILYKYFNFSVRSSILLWLQWWIWEMETWVLLY